MSLHVVPVSLAEANQFVALFHRHHNPVPGSKFSVGVADENMVLRGVAIVGRPVARMLDRGWIAEINRTCTDGTKNANSMLYGACWRALRALGYHRAVTYTMPGESGASLRAAGWNCIGETAGGEWGHPKRPRMTVNPCKKLRWEISDGLQGNHNAGTVTNLRLPDRRIHSDAWSF